MPLLFAACSEKEPLSLLEAPENYHFERNGESTVSFSGQTTRIGMATELIQAMTNFNSTSELLLQMYTNQSIGGDDVDPFIEAHLNESTKSLKSKVAASNDFFASNTVESAQIKWDIQSWITAQVTEVFPQENQLAEPGVAGQIADGSTARFVNAQGLEYNQVVNKALIGALMVDQILNNYLGEAILDAAENRPNNSAETLEEGKPYTTMEHKWDEAFGYLFGASGSNFSDPMATLGNGHFLNKYLSKVNDDPDFDGIAEDIYQALKLGRAAIVAHDYDIRNEQVDIIRENVSKVIAIR